MREASDRSPAKKPRSFASDLLRSRNHTREGAEQQPPLRTLPKCLNQSDVSSDRGRLSFRYHFLVMTVTITTTTAPPTFHQVIALPEKSGTRRMKSAISELITTLLVNDSMSVSVSVCS